MKPGSDINTNNSCPNSNPNREIKVSEKDWKYSYKGIKFSSLTELLMWFKNNWEKIKPDIGFKVIITLLLFIATEIDQIKGKQKG
jgi:hypothetical protein